jgi:hypothetical protein
MALFHFHTQYTSASYAKNREKGRVMVESKKEVESKGW